MLPLAQLQLDHVVRNGGETSFSDLLAVAQAVADIGAPADESAVLVEGAQRTLGARRGDFEPIARGKGIGLVQQCTYRLAPPLAVRERTPSGRSIRTRSV